MEYSAIHGKLIISEQELKAFSSELLYAMTKYRLAAGVTLDKRERTDVLSDLDYAEHGIITALGSLGIDLGVKWGRELDLREKRQQ